MAPANTSFPMGRLLACRSGPLEREPLDPLHVGPLDTDQPRGTVAPGGVHVALVVDVGVARLERVAAGARHLAGLALGRRLQHGPVAHHGLAAGLAVDRPRWPVIVRRALLRVPVVVGEDAEAERGILVEDLALGHVVAEVARDERLVPQHLLDDADHLLAPVGSRVAGEDLTTLGGELLEGPGHGVTSAGHATRRCRAGSSSSSPADSPSSLARSTNGIREAIIPCGPTGRKES